MKSSLANYKSYIHELSAQVENPVYGYFGPHSMAWKINREVVLALGALRALLMQVAHPKVAQGVAEHSSYKARPFSRLSNTLKAQTQIVFGDLAEASSALVRLYARHSSVRGLVSTSDTDDDYYANEPDLLLWVHATLVDSVIYAYKLYLPPLSDAEWDQFYKESIWFAELIGIPTNLIPPDLAKFSEWMTCQISGEEITVAADAHEIANSLLNLPFPLFRPINNLIALGSLPNKLRLAYGINPSASALSLYACLVGIVKRIVYRLPSILRVSPAYRRAIRRCKEP